MSQIPDYLPGAHTVVLASSEPLTISRIFQPDPDFNFQYSRGLNLSRLTVNSFLPEEN